MQIVTSTTPNGIRTRTATIPGRCYGALTFGVGARDETIMNRQITHLVAHLIVARTNRPVIPTKLALNENAVTFSASGTATEVVAHFRDIAESIVTGELIKRFDVERELRIMHIEDDSLLGAGSSGPLTRRFGPRDLGLEDVITPGPITFGKRVIRDWMMEWFVAGNASIALTKPLPVAFDLPLPESPPFKRPLSTVMDTATPAVHAASRSVTLAVVVPEATPEAWSESVRAELQHSVSHRAGLAYSTAVSLTRIDSESTLVSFDIDAPDSELSAAAHIVMDEVRRMARQGVSPESLALGRQYEKVTFDGDPNSVVALLDAMNECELRGWSVRSRNERLAASQGLTSADVAATLNSALETMTLTIGDAEVARRAASTFGLPFVDWEITQPSTAKAWKGAAQESRVWEAKSKGDMPGVDLIITATRILMRDDDRYTRIRFDDLVLLATGQGSPTSIVDSRGCGMEFAASDWKKGDELIAALIAAVRPVIVKELPKR